jgi:hypothetical protein
MQKNKTPTPIGIFLKKFCHFHSLFHDTSQKKNKIYDVISFYLG